MAYGNFDSRGILVYVHTAHLSLDLKICLGLHITLIKMNNHIQQCNYRLRYLNKNHVNQFSGIT